MLMENKLDKNWKFKENTKKFSPHPKSGTSHCCVTLSSLFLYIFTSQLQKLPVLFLPLNGIRDVYRPPHSHFTVYLLNFSMYLFISSCVSLGANLPPPFPRKSTRGSQRMTWWSWCSFHRVVLGINPSDFICWAIWMASFTGLFFNLPEDVCFY